MATLVELGAIAYTVSPLVYSLNQQKTKSPEQYVAVVLYKPPLTESWSTSK